MRSNWRASVSIVLTLFMLFAATPLSMSAQDATPVTDSRPAAAPSDVQAPDLVAPQALTIDLFVEATFCQDDTRAGTTEFTLDTPPMAFMARLQATGSCLATNTDLTNLTVTLEHLESGDTFRQDLTGGPVWFTDLPAGTYIVTVSADGMDPVTSESMEILDAGKRVRIITYIAEEGEVEPPVGEGWGDVYGFIMFCSSADYEEGSVNFVVRNNQMLARAAISTCQVGGSVTGQVMLYPVDADSGEVDLTSGESIGTGSSGEFYTGEIPSGSYALGYISPTTGTLSLSDPFVIQPGGEAFIEISVYSAPVATGIIDVYKDFCLDPESAGDAYFQVTAPGENTPMLAAQAADLTDCRYSDESDGPIGFTLTNVDTGVTWETTLLGFGTARLDGVPAGTYTLTEHYNDAANTSQPFDFAPAENPYIVIVRNFVAEADWEVPVENNELAYAEVFAYICVNQDFSGGGEFFRTVSLNENQPELMVAAAATGAETAECREATEADGLSFVLTPADPEAEEIVLSDGGSGFYYSEIDFPAGDYTLTETTTGATTGVLRLVGDHFFEFLKYEELAATDVTINVSSADPAIADTLPADATWTISQDGVEIASDTFAAEDLALPTSISVTNPVPYGDYEVTVSAGPTFLAWSSVFTVDEPSEIFNIVLIPAEEETATVQLAITSADLGIADQMPEGSTWTITSVDNPALTMTQMFADDELLLPVTIFVETPLPHGDYIVTVNAEPTFDPYSRTFTVGDEGASAQRQGFFALQQAPVTFEIVLQPAQVEPSPSPSPTVEPSVTPTATTTPEPGVTPTSTPAGKDDKDVTALPSTGQGASGSQTASVLLVSLASAALVAGAGAILVRQKRT